jgi:cytochrome c-type biogenesis protein
VNLINLAVAFGAGVISITSPCCLPLLPGYLGYLTGLSSAGLQANRRRTIAAALLFVAGFSMVFVALGATASVVGDLLLRYRLPVAHVAGVFILAMGIVLVLEGRVEVLSRGGDWSRWSAGGKVWAAPMLGAAFAITWTPCIGPVLGAILTLAGSTAALDQGVALLAAYSLGLALPFLCSQLLGGESRHLVAACPAPASDHAISCRRAATGHGCLVDHRSLAAPCLPGADLVRAGPLAANLRDTIARWY